MSKKEQKTNGELKQEVVELTQEELDALEKRVSDLVTEIGGIYRDLKKSNGKDFGLLVIRETVDNKNQAASSLIGDLFKLVPLVASIMEGDESVDDVLRLAAEFLNFRSSNKDTISLFKKHLSND